MPSLPIPRSLPPSIFNANLYRAILNTWFAGIPASARVASSEASSRWFGLGDAASAAAFDQKCRSVALPALEWLGPERYPLPPAAGDAGARKEPGSGSGSGSGNGHHGEEDDAVTAVTAALRATLRGPGIIGSVSGSVADATSPSPPPSPSRPREEAFKSAQAEKRNGVVKDAAATAPSASSPPPPPPPPPPLHAADATLALVLLLDQFTRNTFRDAAGMRLLFSHYDRISLALAREIVREGSPSPSPSPSPPSSSGAGSDSPPPPAILANIDRHPRLRDLPVRRLWLYLPLEHSESVADHDLLDARVAEVRRAAVASAEDGGDGAVLDYVDNYRDFERRHRVIVERFGRYPHRNEVLGRESTREEREYLSGGGERFGSREPVMPIEGTGRHADNASAQSEKESVRRSDRERGRSTKECWGRNDNVRAFIHSYVH